jgi:tetratricopeptide (TPR) repeat protein
MWDSQPEVGAELIGVFLEQHPEHYEALEFCTALHGRQGRFEEMLRRAEDMVRLRPSDGRGYTWRGLARLLTGEPPVAMADIEHARTAGGPAGWVDALRGLALSLLKREVEAISSFDDALGIDPDLVAALLGRAYARAMLGNAGGAVADLTRVLVLEPDNVDVYVLRGNQYVDLFDFAAAEQDYGEALRLGGRNPFVLVRYIYAQSQQRASGQAGAESESDREATQEPPSAAEPTEGERRGSMESWIERLRQGLRREEEPSRPAPPRGPRPPAPLRNPSPG